MTSGSESLLSDESGGLRREVRRWICRRPHVVIWRAAMWMVWKRRVPRSWRTLLWINPKPLRGKELDALRAHVDRLERRDA